MEDLTTKPRSGRLSIEHVTRYIDVCGNERPRPDDLAMSYGITLANTDRGLVSLMRVPYSPYYNTSFILKYFKTGDHVQAHREQMEVEAASLHHAAEALQRNNNICRAPEVYDVWPDQNVIAMERIRGRGFWESPQGWWSKERMIKFVRHMAVVRLAILTQVENELGVPRHSTDRWRVGPYCGGVWWDEDRYRFRKQMNRGPFPNRHQMILASLRRELLVFRRMRRVGEPVPDYSHFDTLNEIIEYLSMIIENIDQVPRPNSPEFFSLNHNDLYRGLNIMVRGSKVAALIDWEAASYDPLSLCIADLASSTDFNPRVWREHAGPNGQNFHVLPYRLEYDPMQQRLYHATTAGAERKPFPDWQLIDNNGGPLDVEDFFSDNYPEDISSDDDESIVDAAEMHCDSDIDAEEEFVPRTAPETQGLILPGVARKRPEGPASNWYYEPVYALMKEFIHHQRGAGLGPDREWGRLPEEYSRPLEDWDDPLFARVAHAQFTARHYQLINADRVDMAVSQAAANVPAPTQNVQPKTHKSPKRQRRVPTLIGGVYDGPMVGTEISPESPIPSGSSAYLAWNPPRRVRPHLRPIATRKASRNCDPIPASALQRAREQRKAKQWAEMDHPSIEAPLPNDDVLVKGVRGSIISQVMEKLSVMLDRGAGVP
ncbi:hypothetical protein HOY82DRAFT_637530 [Tuber indicum]|nr:hypothetical protein HOY82DRAFT_637530 [Tuber indicum]